MPLGAKSVGSGLPNFEGIVPRIGISSVPKSNKPLAVNLSRVAPGSQAWLVVGDPSDPVNFPALESRLGIPPQALLVNANELFPVTTYAVAPGKGSATVELQIPPSSVGMKFRAEWIVMNPLGTPAPVSLSRALEITIQP